jgi:HEPN domain-containing protein
MKKITGEWIIKAEKDYLVAVRELKAEPPATEAVCFHAQQCIEKYMKAILQENEAEFEKIHDLDVLLRQCMNFMPALENHRDELVKLSTYAVDVRYPGLDVTEEEAKECVEIMEEIRRVIRNYFKIAEHQK